MIIDKIDSKKCMSFCNKRNINCKKQCNLSKSNKTDLQIVKKACKFECLIDKDKNSIQKKKICIRACNKITFTEKKIPKNPIEPIIPIEPITPITPEVPKSPIEPITPINPVEPITPKNPEQEQENKISKLYLTQKNILKTSFNDDTKIIPILSISKDEGINIIEKETNSKIELPVGKTYSQYHKCQEPGKVIYMDQNTNVDLEPKYIIKTLVNPNPGEEKYMCSLYKDEHKYDTEKGENHTNRTGHGIHSKKINDVTDFEVLCANGKNPQKDCSIDI